MPPIAKAVAWNQSGIVMKATLQVPKNELETEAEDHAEETRYAVSHKGRELHPAGHKKSKPAKASSAKQDQDRPWQID